VRHPQCYIAFRCATLCRRVAVSVRADEKAEKGGFLGAWLGCWLRCWLRCAGGMLGCNERPQPTVGHMPIVAAAALANTVKSGTQIIRRENGTVSKQAGTGTVRRGGRGGPDPFTGACLRSNMQSCPVSPPPLPCS
jgi:hypothetical protein